MTFRIASDLHASADEVWAHSTSFEGINAELGPVLRMSAPHDVREAGIEAVPLKEPWFRSWLLLFGVLPIDYDHLRILELEPGYLLEDSTMLTARRWGHERIVAPIEDGCRIEDRLSWEPRLPPLGWVLHSVVPMLFEHRHAVLRRRFGGRRAVVDR